ncbi:MAG: PAS domain-containing protein [Syntrophales bacterium]|nr:PAS domain-containing protein [Syntrophales bacterium]
MINTTRQFLIALSYFPSVTDGKSTECNAVCNALVSILIEKHYQRYSNVGAAKPNGDVFCSALSLAHPVNIADRKYFKNAIEARDFSMGDYQIGRITGEPSVNFGYPVIDKRGNIKGVVFAAMDLQWLNRFELEVTSQLPKGSTLTKIDSKGIILAHHYGHRELLGKLLPIKSLLETIKTQEKGVVEAIDSDGIPRIYAFGPLHSKMASGKMYVILGIPTEVAFSEINHIMTRNLSLMGLVALLVFAAIWIGSDRLILRPVNLLLNVTRRLSSGDLGARSGFSYRRGELGQLSHAFDEMAETLQRQEEERKQSEKALQRSEHQLRLVTDSLPVLIAYVDSEQRYRFNNKTYEEWFGRPRAEIYGSHISEIMDEEAYLAIQKYVKAALAGQETRYESERLLKDGKLHDVSAIYVPHFGEQGEVLGYFALVTDITERKRAEEQISGQLKQLAALRTIDMAITATLDLRVTLNILLEQVTGILMSDAASVLLLNPYTQMLEYVARRGFITAALRHTELRIGESHAGRAALECHIVNIPDLKENPGSLTRAPLLADEGFITYYGVPLIAKGKVRGVLEIFHRTPLVRNQEWLEFLEALAAQAAIAIDNAALFNDLQRSNIELIRAYDATLEGWSRALDYRDKETEGHSQRVTKLTIKVCRAMGMSDEELLHVRRGALLHDIGKLGVPDNILLKPDKLTEEEWAIMKKHPIISYEILSPISFLRQALDIPYCHHEKWDGTGYPRGLEGEHIPLAARIFSIVDVWDALCSDRPYRTAWPEEEAREHIKEQTCKHFDPKVVEAFLELINGQERDDLSPISISNIEL